MNELFCNVERSKKPKFILSSATTAGAETRLPIVTGVSGAKILRSQPFSRMKCFHAGGEAKWWLADAQRAGLLDHSGDLLDESPVVPFVN
jgi:hypothetical protein